MVGQVGRAGHLCRRIAQPRRPGEHLDLGVLVQPLDVIKQPGIGAHGRLIVFLAPFLVAGHPHGRGGSAGLAVVAFGGAQEKPETRGAQARDWFVHRDIVPLPVSRAEMDRHWGCSAPPGPAVLDCTIQKTDGHGLVCNA